MLNYDVHSTAMSSKSVIVFILSQQVNIRSTWQLYVIIMQPSSAFHWTIKGCLRFNHNHRPEELTLDNDFLYVIRVSSREFQKIILLLRF